MNETPPVASGSLHRAVLRLPIAATATNWGDGRAIVAHRLLRAWTELGATAACAVDVDPSNGAPDCAGETAWDMLAAEAELPFAYEATDTFVVTSGLTGAVTFDVTSDVEALLAGGPSHGWLIRKADEGAAGEIELASRETGGGPELVLTVDPAGGPRPASGPSLAAAARRCC